jgi:hypothetical protein
MPINTNLNIAPYFDDFGLEKQFYKILFKPAYAVQARELTQLQTILQNQVEQFGDNIYQEGSIIKGCNFTNLNGLQFVKLTDKTGFDPELYMPVTEDEVISGATKSIDTKYEVEGAITGLRASIIITDRGFETRPPNLNTLYINYLNTNETGNYKTFISGEELTINRYKYDGSTLISTDLSVATINVTQLPTPTGKSFGIQAAAGVVFQKGHFLFADDQTLVVSKYDNQPDGISVGYEVAESLISSLQDNSLYDNANGSTNENAPGADRLKMVPTLVAKTTAVADVDANFFTLIRYENGSAVTLRDVSQFNSIAEELAKRTYEESGDYIVENFKVTTERRGVDLKALVGKGSAYIKGYRVENRGNLDVTIDPVTSTNIQQNQAISLNYGGYVDITSVNGTMATDYSAVQLQLANGTQIGSAFVKNFTPTKLYLFGASITDVTKTFADVERIVSTSGSVSIAAGSKIKDTKNAPMVFNTGARSLKEITDVNIPVRTQSSVSVTANTITINAQPGDDFAVDNSDIVVVDASNTLIAVNSYSTAINNSILTINLAPGSDPAADVYYNKRIVNTSPYNKLSVNPYIKVIWNNGETRYSLGFPDVYAIDSVVDSLGNDFTDCFRLVTNAQDNFYDISYMEVIAGRTKPTSGTLTVKLKVFKINNATGINFFAVNSYPTDDVTTILPTGKIRSSDVPTYISTSGTVYRLRECIDFRPYADLGAGASYTALTDGAASVVTAAVGAVQPSFAGSDYVIPMVNGNATSDIEHYLARIDAITLDSYGKSAIIKGEEDELPVPPKVGADQLVISEITIPGYPMLSAQEGADQNKNYYAVSTKASGVRNYTMRDIAKLEKKLDAMEYYISLNQLEQATQNLNVTDENGLTRFKNGFIVDPFNDTSIADLSNPDYQAAVHSDTKSLSPALNTFPLDLKYKSGTTATIFPSTADAEIATLSRNAHTKLLGQPYATNFRNCVSNFWKYDGVGSLSPSHDMAQDTVTNPVTLDIDLATPFRDFVDNLQQFVPMTVQNFSNTTTTMQHLGGRQWSIGGSTTTSTTALSVNEATSNQSVGDFVSNFEFQPYMRSREIKVFAAGLRPNTQHYFFFDGVDVNEFVRPGTTANTSRAVRRAGIKGAAVTTDSNGKIRAIFELPDGTFFVGDRVLTVVDVSQYSSIESASTSIIDLQYHAYNISVEKSALTASTRVPDTDVGTEITTRTLPARTVTIDPLAQTFFIKKGMGRGSNSVFISKIDLFFKRKSAINGVTVMLREVINGYPASQVLPFSKIHLNPSQINATDDASTVTTVDFDAPIRMDVEKEYSVVIMPDANDPNYLVFTSKVGGIDLTPGATQGQAVVQDWGDGVLFSSTNNRAWKSYQDEDLKFTLYRHDFNASTGSVTMTNDDHEFLTLSDWDGRFAAGEEVYEEKALTGATSSTVSMPINGTTITGTSLNDSFASGDKILVTNAGGSRSEIFEVVSVDSATEITTERPVDFTVGSGTCKSIVVGKIVHYNRLERSKMYLAGSTATASKKFTASGTIVGFDSGTTGTIGTIDNINLSYVQPLIMKANDSITTTKLSGTFTDPADTLTSYNMPMKFGGNNTFGRKGVVLFSKSNDTARAKPFDITVTMGNSANSTSSPIVDLETSSLLAYQYKATNDAATTSKYISKTIELNEDLDAEDIEVFLTGYRPSGSDIKVYIRPQNVYDSASFNTIPWIELEVAEGINLFSSDTNVDDYREFKYVLPEANKDGAGALEYTSTSGTFMGYRKFAIRIDMLTPDISKSPTVRDYRALALT